MQIIQSKSNIVEKVLRDKEGRLVRARFQVYEISGRIKARLLDFTYINELAGTVSNFYISLKKSIHSSLGHLMSKLGVFESPFLNLTSIFYSGSKPRAPTQII